MDIDAFRTGLLAELGRLATLSDLDDGLLQQSSPCDGWTAQQVLEHVVVTPPMLIDGLRSHLGIDAAAEPSLNARRRQSFQPYILALAELLEQLSDTDLENDLPGPVGLMPGRVVLSLALTELTLHRCDVALATGADSMIPEAYVEAVLTTIIDWLLLLSGSGLPPARPMTISIQPDGLDPQSLQFDGATWQRGTGHNSHSHQHVITGRGSSLTLFLAGRLPFASAALTSHGELDPAQLKIHLPGP